MDTNFSGLRLSKGGKVTTAWANALIDAIQKGQIESVIGGTFESKVTGTTLKFPLPKVPSFPFKLKAAPSGLIVEDGTIGGNVPQIDDADAGMEPINEEPKPVLALDDTVTSGPGYDIYFRFSIYPGVENLGTDDTPVYRVQGGSIIGDPAEDPEPIQIVNVAHGDPLPDDAVQASVDIASGDVTAGVEYRLIATWRGVAMSSQPIMTSLDFSICSDGITDGQSMAKLTLGLD